MAVASRSLGNIVWNIVWNLVSGNQICCENLNGLVTVLVFWGGSIRGRVPECFPDSNPPHWGHLHLHCPVPRQEICDGVLLVNLTVKYSTNKLNASTGVAMHWEPEAMGSCTAAEEVVVVVAEEVVVVEEVVCRGWNTKRENKNKGLLPFLPFYFNVIV